MAIYRNIQTTFWTDPNVCDDYTPNDKLFYIYLMTNPHTNLCGCYEISIRQMAYEIGFSIEEVKDLLEKAETEFKTIEYSKETKELLIVKWSKYNWTSSYKFKASISKEVQMIKNPKFKDFLTSILENDTLSEKNDTLSNFEDTLSEKKEYPSDTTVTVSVTDTVTDTVSVSDTVSDTVIKTDDESKTKRFIPPTIEQVSDFCSENNYTVDPEDFVNFYTSKGWMVGKNKMKDWKSAVRTWQARANKQARGDPTALNDPKSWLYA